MERAIPGLDWLFTPTPGSWERVARHYPLRLPPAFPPASPGPGVDRPASRFPFVAKRRVTTPCLTGGAPVAVAKGKDPNAGTADAALRPRTFAFAVPRPLTRLELATTGNSLARDSRRSPQRPSPDLAPSLPILALIRVYGFALRGD